MISAGRVLLMPKGDYNPATTYELLDLVSYQNSSYIAKGTTTGNLPTDATYWQLSAFGGSVANLTGNFAEIESSSIAQAPHAIGDVFVDLDSRLVEATAQINVNDTIAVGTNCAYTTVETLLNKIAASALKLIADNAITVQTDLDTVTTLGDYYKAATTFYVTNAPTGIDSNPLSTFRLTVLKGAGSSDILQSIVSSDGKTYKRGYDGSTWGTWVEYALSSTVSGLNTRLTTAETDIDNLETSRLKTYTADSTAWDTAPTSASTKPVTSGGIKTEIDKKLPTYANDSTAWDTAPTASSTNPVTSDGIKTELDKKLPTYANGSGSWDTTPTASSTKPVTSGGVKTQIDTINGNKANQTVIATRQANLSATRRYEFGDQFIYNNTLYKVTATAGINQGGTINIGSGGNATTADNVTTQISNMVKFVANSVTANMDLGSVASVRLNYPTGYTFHSLQGFGTSDWTVVFKGTNVQSTYVEVQGVKVISGAASVTISASIACIKKELYRT